MSMRLQSRRRGTPPSRSQLLNLIDQWQSRCASGPADTRYDFFEEEEEWEDDAQLPELFSASRTELVRDTVEFMRRAQEEPRDSCDAKSRRAEYSAAGQTQLEVCSTQGKASGVRQPLDGRR